MKNILIILVLLISLTLQSQINPSYVTGTVFDNNTQLPVPYATVFINGTTIGCNSNEKGEFILKGVTFPCNIVATHISYEKKVVYVENNLNPLSIFLAPKQIVLKDVKVVGNRNKIREQNLRKFESYFLGDDNWGKQAELLNDSVLVFYEDNQGFHARASGPLLIDLSLLGYILWVDLDEFKVNYNEKYKQEQCSSLAYYYFIPIKGMSENNTDAINNNRSLAYYGSELHFLRSLYRDSLKINGYKIFKEQYRKPGDPIEPIDLKKEYFLNNKVYVIDMIDNTYLKLTGYKDSSITIFYYQKHGLPLVKEEADLNNLYVSRLFFLEDTCLIRANGTIPDNSILFDGFIGERRTGSMLPEDYLPKINIGKHPTTKITRIGLSKNDKKLFYSYLNLPETKTFDGITIGMSIDEFRHISVKVYNRGIISNSIDFQGSNFDSTNYYVFREGNPEKIYFTVVPICYDDGNCTVGKILVYYRGFKTNRGIRIGNTLGDLKTKYTVKGLFFEDIDEGPFLRETKTIGVRIEGSHLVFFFNAKEIPKTLWGNPSLSDLNDKFKIIIIGIL